MSGNANLLRPKSRHGRYGMRTEHLTGKWRSSAWVAALVLALIAWASVPSPSFADGRVALVIGNSEYGAEIGRLKNPANDARLMAEMLRGLGFDVSTVVDGNRKSIRQAIQGFGKKLREAGPEAIGLFYYAGHGLQVQGQNFLIPTDADIQSEADVEDAAISADYVLRQMELAGNAVNLVFLDACRNNPLTRSFRSSERGLARLDGPTGSFIGYSTAPNSVAADGDGANSPYATALARELAKPGQSILAAHLAVRASVMNATGKQQVPWDTSSLTGDVVLASLAPEATPGTSAQSTAPAPIAGSDKEALFWESIKDSDDPALFESYLKRYPDGTFVDIATSRLARLRGGQQAAVTQDPADTGEITIEELDASYVATQSANIRGAPSTGAAVVGRLVADEPVAVTGKVSGKDWFRIAWKGQTGYVSAKLLAEADAGEIAAWQKLRGAPTEEAVAAFLKLYPGSYFRDKAKTLLASQQSPDPATETAATEPSVAAPTQSGMIREEDLAKVPSDLRPDSAIVAMYNASPAFTRWPCPRPYKLVTRYAPAAGTSETTSEEETTRIGNLYLWTNVNTFSDTWDNVPGAYKSASSSRSLNACGLDLASSYENRISRPGHSAHASSKSMTVDLAQAQGELFPLKVGNQVSYEYTQISESTDTDGKTTNQRRTHRVETQVLGKSPCSTIYPMIPGDCFKMRYTFDTLNDDNPPYTSELYYSEAFNFWPPLLENRDSDGKLTGRTSILSFTPL